ncbi:MAG: NAD(P)-dependent glycerol-1-phosphate dehydrogenase [Candidatus Methanomethylicota archaeon]|uniref:Glycerol-1-phosphate dehydrogenase [NAD(P)+] n=1 Tax=Thermoproteota archaeon TaxID=2056631 RepID=A0A497EV09_9CREN|nr:MAG: NAD(P)-dependent glycerol-1-phosphate dehydrogenase [Candidatus Verstraetearchaeota archaeon]
MKFHAIHLPRFVLVGEDIVDSVGRVCLDLGFAKGSTVLVLSGNTSTRYFGDVVRKSLAEVGFNAFLDTVEESSSSLLERVLDVAKETKPNLIIGVGGGKAIDLAKLASFKLNLQFISVPTSASHDGIASPRASLMNERGALSELAHPPIAIIADVNVIYSAPRRLLVSGCGDILGKFTAVRDWRLAHKLRGEYYGEYSASLALLAAKMVKKDAEMIGRHRKESVRTVIEALISCGYAMSIAGSSRPCSGSEHLFSHALSRVSKTRALHGEKVGVGSIMMMYLHGGDWKGLRSALKVLGAPTTAKELGVTAEEVIEALTLAHTIRPERYTILGDKGISQKAAEELAIATGVID